MAIFGRGNASGRRGGGLGGRLIIRLIIAAVVLGGGLITYYSSSEENPYTGEKQHLALNVSQEVQMGLAAAPKMAQQMGGAVDPRSDPRAAKVQQIGQKLADSIPTEKNAYKGHFEFHLLDDRQTVNAFALPGGQIFITEALYDKMDNEAELAGVLGHEIGHVIHRHSNEQMAKGQLASAITQAVTIGASDSYSHAQIAQMAASYVANIKMLSYSRKDELQADGFGLYLMPKNGYDPRAMLEVMEILKKASGGGGGGSDFMKTHPNPEARIEQINAYLKKTYPNGVPSDLTQGGPLR